MTKKYCKSGNIDQYSPLLISPTLVQGTEEVKLLQGTASMETAELSFHTYIQWGSGDPIPGAQEVPFGLKGYAHHTVNVQRYFSVF